MIGNGAELEQRVHSFIHSLNGFIHSFTHSLARSFIHSLMEKGAINQPTDVDIRPFAAAVAVAVGNGAFSPL